VNLPIDNLRPCAYEFGQFRADLQNFLLLRNGEPLPLQPKVFDTLMVLLEHHGAVISKDALMSRLWPDTIVEESNLTQAISVLRKILGEGADGRSWIETIPKRGYRFSAEVKTIVESGVEPLGARSDSHLMLVSADGHITGGRTAEAPEEQSLTSAPNKRTWRPRALIAVTAVIVVSLVTAFISARNHKNPQPASTSSRESTSDRKSTSPQEPTSDKEKKLAVLPFMPVVLSERNEALEIGITETIINKLNVIRGLTTFSLNSVRQYTNPERDAAAVGRDLGVDLVLDGKIQRDGDTIRVTWWLLRSIDGYVMMSDQRDERWGERLFKLQDDIANSVAQALKFQLSANETRLLQKQDTVSVEAYQLYCKGLIGLESRNRKAGKKALEQFTSATVIDPTYARAYVGIARIQNEWKILRPELAREAAESALVTALDVEPNFPEARALLAYIRFERDRNKEAAEPEFQQAIKDDDRSWDARYYYARFLGQVGRHEEAIEEARKNRNRAPLSPFYLTAFAIQLSKGSRSQCEESIHVFEEALRLEPNRVGTLSNLGRAYLKLERYDEAIEALEKALENDPEPAAPRYALLAETYAKVGNKDRAKEMLILLEAVNRKGEDWISPASIESIRKALAE
jgi:DNA-binding winged helix-turn-helix (wHTH) protein/TolB-like protein/tetratricopeptide (TPR) repeat protein